MATAWNLLRRFGGLVVTLAILVGFLQMAPRSTPAVAGAGAAGAAAAEVIDAPAARFGTIEALALTGALLYGGAVVLVLRSVRKDQRRDYAGDVLAL